MGFLDKLAKLLNGNDQQYTIKMENLSPLWLRYNSDYTPQPTDESIAKNEIQSPTEEKTSSPSQISPLATKGIDFNTLFDPLLDIINNNYNEVFNPYKDLLVKVLGIVDKYGNVPSVVLVRPEIDSIEYETSIYELLSKIQLKEHLVNTAINIIRIVEKKYDPKTPLLPMFVFAALLHDIGKSSDIRESSNYSKADHPIISANFANDIIPDENMLFAWKPDMLNAIRSHHDTSSQDNATILLKEADAMTRQIEVSKIAAYKIANTLTDSNWFDVDDFVQNHFVPIVNVDQNDKWIAISYKNSVYIETRNLYKLVQKYMMEKNIIDLRFIRMSLYYSAINFILSHLYKAHYIKSESAKNIKISYVNKIYSLSLIEFNIGKLGVMPNKLEARKTPSLETFRVLS